MLLRKIQNPVKTKRKNVSDLWPIRLSFLCDLQRLCLGGHTRIVRGPFRVFWKAYKLTNSNNDNKRLFDVIQTYCVDSTMVTTDFYIQCLRCHKVYARVNRSDWLWGLDGPPTDVWQNAYIFPCTCTRAKTVKVQISDLSKSVVELFQIFVFWEHLWIFLLCAVKFFACQCVEFWNLAKWHFFLF